MNAKERKQKIFIKTYTKLFLLILIFLLINIYAFISRDKAFLKKYNQKYTAGYYLNDYEEKTLKLKQTNLTKKETEILESKISSMTMNKSLLDNFYRNYIESKKTEAMNKELKDKKDIYFKSRQEVTDQQKKISKIKNQKILKITTGQLKVLKKEEYKINGKKKDSIKKDIFNRGFYYLLFSLLPFLALLNYKKKDTHGSARWAKFSDLGERKTEFEDINLLANDGVTIGRYQGLNLYDNSNTHLMICAPTRSGKGVGVVIPTLVHSWKESIIVLDIKGENQVFTANARRKYLNNKAITLFFNDKRSIKYNPLEEIKYNSSSEIANARSVAEIIINTGANNNDSDFWSTSSIDILTGVILYCLYSIKDRKANLYDVVKFLSQDKIQENCSKLMNMPILNEIEACNLRNYYQTETNLIDRGIHPFVNRTITQIATTTEKTWSGFLSTMKTKIAIFEMPIIVQNTEKSEFSIRDIANYKKPVALYLRLNAKEIPILKPLVNIFLSQLVNELMSNQEFEMKIFKNTHKTLFLLDEFPAMGKLKTIEETITFSAGYGLKYALVIQNLEQLYKIYTDKNPFMGNCQLAMFYTPTSTNTRTAEEISKMVGEETIKIKNRTSAGSTRSSVSSNFTNRKLLTPDEVLRYSKKQSLIIAGNKPVIQGTKIRYFEEEFYKERIIEDNDVTQDKL